MYWILWLYEQSRFQFPNSYSVIVRFLAVPRVWEKMYEKIMAVGASSGYIKKQIALWAKDKGLKYHVARING